MDEQYIQQLCQVPNTYNLDWPWPHFLLCYLFTEIQYSLGEHFVGVVGKTRLQQAETTELSPIRSTSALFHMVFRYEILLLASILK